MSHVVVAEFVANVRPVEVAAGQQAGLAGAVARDGDPLVLLENA